MSKPNPVPNPCNVLLIGGGGREHALAWRIAESPRLGTLYVNNTSNAALRDIAKTCDVEWNTTKGGIFHFDRWCDAHDIHLIVVGPEQPLAEGIADALTKPGRIVFGPTKAGARLESDKWYAKEVMKQASVPTADARKFTNPEFARDYVTNRDEPCVVKATGLAAGKGAIVCNTTEEAIAAIDALMVNRTLGASGDTILIEEKLLGQEVSIMALVDGRTIWMLDPCQDHKQRDEGDTGPNTGGMGAYCPAPIIDNATMATIEREVIVPTVDALRRDGIEYRGVLYAGLMLTAAGPKVLEFNVRFGDPECQPLMARLKSDPIELFWATATGTLDRVTSVNFHTHTACCVVMCSAGYPGTYETGKPIMGIKDAEELPGVKVFHAGTKIGSEGVETNGGRVLGVTALADDLLGARNLANEACDRVHFAGAFFRRDIGERVLGKAVKS